MYRGEWIPWKRVVSGVHDRLPSLPSLFGMRKAVESVLEREPVYEGWIKAPEDPTVLVIKTDGTEYDGLLHRVGPQCKSTVCGIPARRMHLVLNTENNNREVCNGCKPRTMGRSSRQD